MEDELISEGLLQRINELRVQTYKHMTLETFKRHMKEIREGGAPKNYGKNNYPFNIKDCPGYEGYIPDNLGHEVCKYCGSIDYYH